MATDTLSDVLRAVRLTGAVFFNVDASSPFVAEAPPGRDIAHVVIPGAHHLIPYHVVTTGGCYVAPLDAPSIRLEAGDIVVFPQGDAHVVSSAPGMRAEPVLSKYSRPPGAALPFAVTVGGGGADRAKLVCGFLGCDARPFNPLLGTLPRVLVARSGDEGPGMWLRHFIELAVSESNGRRAGSECVLARLSELMFVEVVRRHVETMPRGEGGWLAALRDEFVGRALGALHDRPAHPWTLEELAQVAGLSRSSFAERFTQLVGTPAMQYLTQWRMQLAAGLLAAGGKVASVADEVGYESEAAFSRAFKRAVGISPGAWREHGGPADGACSVAPA